MKLAGLFATVALANNEGDRKFANKPEFLTGETPSYWNNHSRFTWVDRVNGRIDAFWDRNMRNSTGVEVSKDLNKHFHTLIGQTAEAANECLGGESGLVRKRRSDGEERAWGSSCIQYYGSKANYYCFMELEQFDGVTDQWKNLNRLTESVGRFVVEELYKPVHDTDASKKCKKRAWKLVSF